MQPTCVLESDFGFKINCAFKKSSLFRVRNLGGIKAHASLGKSRFFYDDESFSMSLSLINPTTELAFHQKYTKFTSGFGSVAQPVIEPCPSRQKCVAAPIESPHLYIIF